MLLEKLILLQATANVESIEYQIAYHALSYTVQQKIEKATFAIFLKDLNMSKSSCLRVIKNLGCSTYKRFTATLYAEYLQIYQNLKTIKKKEQVIHKDSRLLAELLIQHNKIVILGNNNDRFSLLPFMVFLICLEIDITIPVYYKTEEEIGKEYQLQENDLVIIICLNKTIETFMGERVWYYEDSKYLVLETKATTLCIGECVEREIHGKAYGLEIERTETLSNKLYAVHSLFEEAIQYIATKKI